MNFPRKHCLCLATQNLLKEDKRTLDTLNVVELIGGLRGKRGESLLRELQIISDHVRSSL
jgi:hypothetical protein